MKLFRLARIILGVAAAVCLAPAPAAVGQPVVTLAPGNLAQQWNTIAQDKVVNTPGIFQNEAFL
jgi:hypothetical protein